MYKHYKKFIFCLIILLLITCLALFIRAKLPVYTKYLHHVYDYAEKYDLSPSLVLAVIKTESNFDPYARSHRDAYGLMQITAETLDWAMLREGNNAEHTVEDLYDPETNIKYGCYILHLFLEEFEDTKTALAAYNAGRSNVLKWLKDNRYSEDGISLHSTPYEETNNYMEKVIEHQEKYKKITGESE